MCAGFHTGFYALGGTFFGIANITLLKMMLCKWWGLGASPPQKICEKIAVLRLNLVGCGPVAARQHLYVFKVQQFNKFFWGGWGIGLGDFPGSV